MPTLIVADFQFQEFSAWHQLAVRVSWLRASDPREMSVVFTPHTLFLVLAYLRRRDCILDRNFSITAQPILKLSTVFAGRFKCLRSVMQGILDVRATILRKRIQVGRHILLYVVSAWLLQCSFAMTAFHCSLQHGDGGRFSIAQF